jgi:hypothetical protein
LHQTRNNAGAETEQTGFTLNYSFGEHPLAITVPSSVLKNASQAGNASGFERAESALNQGSLLIKRSAWDDIKCERR